MTSEVTSEVVACMAIVFAVVVFVVSVATCTRLFNVMSAMAADLERLRQERFDGAAESMRRNFRLQEAEETLERIRREIVRDDDDA